MNGNDVQDDIGVKDIIVDKGKAAAAQEVDLGEFFRGLWDYAYGLLNMDSWDWANIGGIGVILGAMLFILMFATGRGRD